MSYYSRLRLERAITEAERQYTDWQCKITSEESQEYGMQDLHTFFVVIDGQYAEDDAYDFFRDYGFHSVSEEYTAHSFAELRIEIVGS
jgi:predicted GNAT family N-acyltransferase